MGEELNAAEVTEGGLVGDRRFAVVDPTTGKVAGAKNPRKWGNFFDFRAAYVEPPQAGSTLPTVRLTLLDGTVVTSKQLTWKRSSRVRSAVQSTREATASRRVPPPRSTGRIWKVSIIEIR